MDLSLTKPSNFDPGKKNRASQYDFPHGDKSNIGGRIKEGKIKRENQKPSITFLFFLRHPNNLYYSFASPLFLLS